MSSKEVFEKTVTVTGKPDTITAVDIAAKLLSEPKIREELQSWIDEIEASGPPWSNYLRARQMGLISDQFSIVDLALATGLVRIKGLA